MDASIWLSILWQLWGAECRGIGCWKCFTLTLEKMFEPCAKRVTFAHRTWHAQFAAGSFHEDYSAREFDSWHDQHVEAHADVQGLVWDLHVFRRWSIGDITWTVWTWLFVYWNNVNLRLWQHTTNTNTMHCICYTDCLCCVLMFHSCKVLAYERWLKLKVVSIDLK